MTLPISLRVSKAVGCWKQPHICFYQVGWSSTQSFLSVSNSWSLEKGRFYLICWMSMLRLTSGFGQKWYLSTAKVLNGHWVPIRGQTWARLKVASTTINKGSLLGQDSVGWKVEGSNSHEVFYNRPSIACVRCKICTITCAYMWEMYLFLNNGEASPLSGITGSRWKAACFDFWPAIFFQNKTRHLSSGTKAAS